MGLQLASDNFQRANENPLSDGGNWTTVTTDQPPQIVGNLCEASTVISVCAAFWSGLTWPNDQYSEVTVAAIGFLIDALVRTVSAVATFYMGRVETVDNNVSLAVEVAGSFTLLASTAPASIFPKSGDVLRVQAQGNTISLLYNGVQRLSVTDSTIASGSAGFRILPSSSVSDTSISNWDGGKLAGFGGAPSDVYDPHRVTPSPRGPGQVQQATVASPRVPSRRVERR